MSILGRLKGCVGRDRHGNKLYVGDKVVGYYPCGGSVKGMTVRFSLEKGAYASDGYSHFALSWTVKLTRRNLRGSMMVNSTSA